MMQPLYSLNTNNTNRTYDVNNKSVCYNYNMWNGQNVTSGSSNSSRNDNNNNKDSKTFVRRYDMFVKNTASNDCYSTPASSAEHNVFNINNNNNSMYNDTPRVNGLSHEHAHQTSKSARNRVSYCDQSPHETHVQMHDTIKMIYGNSRTMNNTHNQVDAMSQTLPLHVHSNNNNINNNNNNNSISGVNSVYPFTPKLFEIIPPSPSLVPVTLPITNTATESVYNRSNSSDATNILNPTVNGINAYCRSSNSNSNRNSNIDNNNNNNNGLTVHNKSMLLAVPATWATSQGPMTSSIPLPTSTLKNVQVNKYENNHNNNNNNNNVNSGSATLQPPIYYVPISPSTQKLQHQEPSNELLLSSHVAPVLTSLQNSSHMINAQQKPDTTSHSQWPSANYPCYLSTSPSNSTTLPVENLTNVNLTSFTPASSIITVLPSQSVCSMEGNTHQARVNANLQPERITRAEYVGETDTGANSHGVKVTATPVHSSIIYHHYQQQQQQDQEQLKQEHYSTTLPSPDTSITLFPVPPSFSLPPLPPPHTPPVNAPPACSYLPTEATTNRNNNNNAESYQSNTYASQATAPAIATTASSDAQFNFALNTNTNNGAEYINNMIMTVNNTSRTSINSSPSRHGSISSVNNLVQVNNNTNNKINMMDLHSQEPQSYMLPSQLQTQQETQLSETDSLYYRRNSSSLSNSAHYCNTNSNSNNNSNTRLSIHSVNSTFPVMSEQRHLPIFVHPSNEFISPAPPPPPITMLLPHKNSLSSFTSSTTSLSTNRLAAVAVKASPIPQIQVQIQDQARKNTSHSVCPNECVSALQHEDYNKRSSDNYNELIYSQYHHHDQQRTYTNNNSGSSQNRKHMNENDKNIITTKSEGNNIYDTSDTSITNTNTIRLPITYYDRKRVWHEVLLNERHLNYPNVPLPKEFANLGDSEERRRRLEQRHKQIMYGKDTEGYLKYTTLIPEIAQREFHNPMHPITPRPENDCSKRTFDKYLNSWRRQLHQWDECDLNYLSREFTPMKVATLGDLHLATFNTNEDNITKNKSINNNNNTNTTKEEEVGKYTLVEPCHHCYVCTESNKQKEERLFHNFTEEEELEELHLEELNYEKELELLEHEFEMQDNSMVIPVPTFSSSLSTPSSDDFSFFFSSKEDNKDNCDYYTNNENNKPTALSFNSQNNDNVNDDSCTESKNEFANKYKHYDKTMTPHKTTKMQHTNDLQLTDYNSYIDRINSNDKIIIINNTNVNEGSKNHDKLWFAAKDELSSNTLNDLMTNSALHLTDTTSSTITENIYNSNNNYNNYNNSNIERQSVIYNTLYKTNVNDLHEVSIRDHTQSDANNAMSIKHSNTFVREKTQLSESFNAHQSDADNSKRQLTIHDTNKMNNNRNKSINCKNNDQVIVDNDDDDDSFMSEFNQDMPSLNLNIDFTTPESTLEYILSERVSIVPSTWTPSQTIATDTHKRNTLLRTLGTTPMTFTGTANGAYGNGETTINSVPTATTTITTTTNITSNNNDIANDRTDSINEEYEKENQLVEILTPVSPQTNHHNRSERSCGFMSLSRPQTITSEIVPHKVEPARVREYTCNTSHNKNINRNCTINITTTTSDKNDNTDEEDSFNALLDDVLGKVCSSRSTSQLTNLPHVIKSSRAATLDNSNTNSNNNNNKNFNNENKNRNNNNNNSEIISIFSSPSPTPPSSRRTKQSSSSIRMPLRKIVINSNSNSNTSSPHFAKEKGSTNNRYERLSSIASLNPLSGRCSEAQLSLPSLNQTGVSSSAVSINNNYSKNCYSINKSGSNTVGDCVGVEDDHDNN